MNETIEAKFSTVKTEGKEIIICTIKRGITAKQFEEVRIKLKEIFAANPYPSVIFCDDRFRFYNVDASGLIVVKTEDELEKKKHWWSRR